MNLAAVIFLADARQRYLGRFAAIANAIRGSHAERSVVGNERISTTICTW